MEPLFIAQTNETPEVALNAADGKFTFVGKSYPENVNEFYTNVLEYLRSYALNPKEKTSLEFNWLYYNTATAKMIVKIIMELKGVKSKGKSFEIKWFCKSNDDLIQEKGEELKSLLDVDFSIIHV
ncbi:MAG TPA: DUF1987 domain-containing protein [Flavobacteriales bacterium]|nr:DUF1987 domain-containing protein [Flavobacteriales bacterium]